MTKRDIPRPLQGWWGHRFSSGPYTGEDYETFQAEYGRWLRRRLPKYKVDISGGHYEFSAVITKKGGDGAPDRHVYLSISDVRYFPADWYGNVLVRTMKHAEDWCGGTNTYCGIKGIPKRVDELMAEMERSKA